MKKSNQWYAKQGYEYWKLEAIRCLKDGYSWEDVVKEADRLYGKTRQERIKIAKEVWKDIEERTQ